MEYRCLESNFSSTWVQIKAVVRSPRFTKLAFEHVHAWPKVWNTQNAISQNNREKIGSRKEE